jgi:hypothetical protein
LQTNARHAATQLEEMARQNGAMMIRMKALVDSEKSSFEERVQAQTALRQEHEENAKLKRGILVRFHCEHHSCLRISGRTHTRCCRSRARATE